MSRWLAKVGLPGVVAIAPAVDVDGFAVTFWERLPDTRPATPAEIARYLARLHAHGVPAGLDVPEIQPFVRIRDRIEASPIAEADKAFLVDRLEQLTLRWAEAAELPRVIVHGDAHSGNVVAIPSGTVLVLDLERFSIGPAEWDLTLMACEYDSFRWLSADQYFEFATACGHDVLRSPVYPLLRDIRELRMTSWLANKADQGSAVRSELAHRVACLRGLQGDRPWAWTAN